MATITKQGDRYRVRYDVYQNGKRKQRSKNFNRYKDAKAFAVEVENDIAENSYSDDGGMTLTQYLESYYDLYTDNLRTNTRHADRGNMQRHILPHIDNMRLCDITTNQIQRIYTRMLRTEHIPTIIEVENGVEVITRPGVCYSPKTIANINAALSKALKKAVATHLIKHNPCDEVVIPRASDREYIIPTEQELQGLIDAIQATPYYEAILTCAVLGVRRSEALGLFWSDIDLEAMKIQILRRLVYNEEAHALEVGDLKSRASKRVVDLDASLADCLTAMRKHKAAQTLAMGSKYIRSPFVFTMQDGSPIRPTNISKAFKQAAIQAGLPKMRLHDLRHTLVTYTLRSGISPRTVQAIVGHADSRFTLARYAHVIESERREAVNVMGKIIFNHSE